MALLGITGVGPRLRRVEQRAACCHFKRCVGLLLPAGSVHMVAMDGRLAVTASEDGTARVWDLTSGASSSTHTLEGHSGWVRLTPLLAGSPVRQLFASLPHRLLKPTPIGCASPPCQLALCQLAPLSDSCPYVCAQKLTLCFATSPSCHCFQRCKSYFLMQNTASSSDSGGVRSRVPCSSWLGLAWHYLRS